MRSHRPGTGVERPAPARRRHPRRLQLLLASIAALIAVGTLSAASPAGAMIIGPETSTTVKVSGASLTCSNNYNQVRLSINATVPPSGQWMAYRHYLTDGRTSNQTAWTTTYVYPGLYGTASLFDFTFKVWDGGNWNAKAEVMWWDSARGTWTNYQSTWAQRYQALYYYSQAGSCLT